MVITEVYLQGILLLLGWCKVVVVCRGGMHGYAGAHSTLSDVQSTAIQTCLLCMFAPLHKHTRNTHTHTLTHTRCACLHLCTNVQGTHTRTHTHTHAHTQTHTGQHDRRSREREVGGDELNFEGSVVALPKAPLPPARNSAAATSPRLQGAQASVGVGVARPRDEVSIFVFTYACVRTRDVSVFMCACACVCVSPAIQLL